MSAHAAARYAAHAAHLNPNDGGARTQNSTGPPTHKEQSCIGAALTRLAATQQAASGHRIDHGGLYLFLLLSPNLACVCVRLVRAHAAWRVVRVCASDYTIESALFPCCAACRSSTHTHRMYYSRDACAADMIYSAFSGRRRCRRRPRGCV